MSRQDKVTRGTLTSHSFLGLTDKADDDPADSGGEVVGAGD